MSGLFASLSIGRAWEKVSSFLYLFCAAPSSSTSSASHQDDLDELRKLERTMRRIRATLHDAEEHWNIRGQSAKLRLKELKDVAYDDEYEYEVNRCKIEALDRADGVHSTGKRKHPEKYDLVWWPIRWTLVWWQFHMTWFADSVLRARKITDRFNEIIHYSEHMTLSENDGERRFAPDITSLRHTSSVVFEKSILERDQDKDKVIGKLLSREGEKGGSPVSVMAIVGMGGVGKTTVAQLVYNSPRVRQSFEKYAWVCVSEQFDVSTITRNIITSLTSLECKYTQLAVLQRTLANKVNGQRVLLVLDDVWNERRDCWELFCAPLTTSKICQIIVTTRSEGVPRLMQTMPFYHLGCLSFDESWSLFSKAVCIGEQEVENATILIEIGKSIVKRCKGLPLAIKALGSMLRYETDERSWKDVLESELWDFEKPRNEVLPALELSYKHMPVHLRRCLLSLSLFPKDCNVYEKELLRFWELLELFHSDGCDDKYATGRLYLKELFRGQCFRVIVAHTTAYMILSMILLASLQGKSSKDLKDIHRLKFHKTLGICPYIKKSRLQTLQFFHILEGPSWS
ncbi:hypothetical protein BS78_05G119300 [Paspalum vaginatum]|nr:hypothetical protein BS78_05G119300 [Paspalum vaginatum]